jgi:hypothetical protein
MILSFRNMLEDARKSSYFFTLKRKQRCGVTQATLFMQVKKCGNKTRLQSLLWDAIMVRMSTHAMGSVPFVSS